MKHLLLLRHADAQAAAPGSNDSDRPLTAHGRRQAADAAQCVARTGVQIDAVVASPAQRTRETAVILLTQLNLSIAPRYEPSLYLATADTLLRAINECHAQIHSVLLVAHNPGISELTRQLSGGAPASALGTGGLCHLTFRQATWRDLGTPESVEILR
jgi:phosphohistidine phosphatase